MKKGNKNILLGTGLVVLGAFAFYGLYDAPEKISEETANKNAVTIYKSPNCECCDNYAAYMRRTGFDVKVINTNDMNTIRQEHKISQHMASCHTTLVGNYAVEGHIPIEAIQKLLEEKPALKTIAMPGMPSGSPGMPGAKLQPFTIHGITEDGDESVYLEL